MKEANLDNPVEAKTCHSLIFRKVCAMFLGDPQTGDFPFGLPTRQVGARASKKKTLLWAKAPDLRNRI